VLVLPALLAACGWSTVEDQILSTFFEASRTRDKTRLAAVAAVAVEPRVDGSVERFEVESAESERRRPFERPRDEPLALSSLTPPGQQDVDLSSLNLEIGEKQLAVKVELRTPGGRNEMPTLLITMQRAISRRGDHATEGRWIVTAWRRG
jgi:hypothetical protein